VLAAASQVTERIKLGTGIGKSSASTTDNPHYRARSPGYI
jgi:alkanesulfonate monooxygenase SsuD/methylene tetrahydromethanopterin reductase-like flavin-dependent oxidoreductase (luciferase family)